MLSAKVDHGAAFGWTRCTVCESESRRSTMSRDAMSMGYRLWHFREVNDRVAYKWDKFTAKK